MDANVFDSREKNSKAWRAKFAILFFVTIERRIQPVKKW